MAAFDSTLTKFFDSMEGIMPFQPESKALGGSKKSIKSVIKSEASTPLGDVSGFFAGIDKSLINLVNFAKESLGINKESLRLESQIADIMASDLKLSEKENLVNQLKQRDSSLDGVDTHAKGDKKPILSTLKDSFQQVEFGEKMTAILMAGGLFLFLKYRKQIEAALEPVVEFLMGVVDFLGVEGTLMTLFGILVGIKLFPVISAATGVVTYLGKKFLPSFKTLKTAFTDMNKFIKNKLIPGIAQSYKKFKGSKILKLLGGAFSKLRFLLTATLYPAIISMISTLAAAVGPILAPIVIIAAIAAGIAAVLFSLKSGFETFKQSLEDGDSMLLAIGKGIADFALTLATLPITLIKKVIGFIVGLFGFGDIKKAIDKFSFKDMIKKAFVGFISSFVKVIKAIAKGAGAALAAIAPGGKTPQAEFSRVYNEIMQGGAGQIKVEKTDLEKTGTDGQPEITENQVKDQIQKERKDEKILEEHHKTKGFLDFRSDEKVLSDYYMLQDRGKKKTDYKIKAQERKDFLALSAPERRMFKLNEANRIAAGKLDPEAAFSEITSIDAKRIDLSTNVKHETHVTGDLAVDNNEGSQRFINVFGGSHLPR